MEKNSEETIMRACRTCGKWMRLAPGSQQVYCSPECGGVWNSCAVCGRFFLAEEGADEYCSEICRTPPPVVPGLHLDP